MRADGNPARANPDLVKVREFNPSPAQLDIMNSVFAAIGLTCANAEEGVALLVFYLSEFISKTAKPEYIPEAMETAVKCLRINLGMERL